MKFVHEYRNFEATKTFTSALHKLTTKSWNIMEICGGQTHSIMKYGIDNLLPKSISLIHGPGCPVCVTPSQAIDKAIEISRDKNVIFTSFGDMLRVPGSNESLLTAKSMGADVRFIYSPMDALKIAKENPNKEIVFFAIGFETTSSVNAMAIYQSFIQNITNISFLTSQVLVPPAIKALLNSPSLKIQGFLAAGHVCTVTGFEEYEPISKKFKIPIIVTGFEPLDILQGIYMCVKQLESEKYFVENQYSRSVKRGGNPEIIKLMKRVFKVIPKHWRGIGLIPESGLGISDEFKAFDAELKFGSINYTEEIKNDCISGLILTGEKKPYDCPLFSTKCTPSTPFGATMVSNEGSCAAYFKYRKEEDSHEKK